MTLSPWEPNSSASSAVKTTLPTAAPGDALRPVAIGVSVAFAFFAMTSLNSSIRRFGSSRSSPSSREIRSSFTMSYAITHSANAVRLPTRVCRNQSFPRSIVNSMSHMSR